MIYLAEEHFTVLEFTRRPFGEKNLAGDELLLTESKC
jgi:hypothetical protein